MADNKEKVNAQNEEVEIEIVELFDYEGQSMLFELLDTIEHDGNNYLLLTAYDESDEEFELNEPADVFVMLEKPLVMR